MRPLRELHDLSGRVAILTGGAGGVARGFAETALELGARILLVDIDENACNARARELGKDDRVQSFAANLADPHTARLIVSEAMRRFGRLDILVNNAAFTGTTELAGFAVPFAEQTGEAWDAALRVNLTAPFLLAQAAHPLLRESAHGVIVNVGSIYGTLGPNFSLYEGTSMANPAAYGASKGGLINLTRYLATTFAPRVRVNAISPGGLFAHQPEAFVGRYEKLTPLGRMGSEEDLKGIFAFLVSDASAYVTGQNMMIDGGWSAW